MQFKHVVAAAAAGLAATVSATLAGERKLLPARDNAVVIVHEVITYSPSVVYSTRVQTVTQCAADVTNCPDISGVLTSVIDSTITICPVTSTAISTSGVLNPGNSAPLQTLTVTLTNSSTVSEWTSTVTDQIPTVIISDAISTSTPSGSTHSGASTSNSQPVITLASPEDASKTETTSASIAKSTSISYVVATVTLPANGSGPSSFANSTVTINIAASRFSINAIGAVTGTASSSFSYMANGTLATPTASAATASESIVPFLGAAARDVTSPFLVLAMLAILV